MEDEEVVKISTQEFAAKIKAKYPQYEDINDVELTQKIINKYPEYKDQVDLSQGGASDVGKPQGEMGSTQLSEESVSDGGGLTETVGASESQEPQRKFGLTQEAVDQAATSLQPKEQTLEDAEMAATDVAAIKGQEDELSLEKINERGRMASLDIPTLNKTIETSREKLSELESMSSETQQKADEEIGRINDLYTNGEMSRENYESNYATLKQGYEAAGESISTEFNAYSSEYTRAIADKQALRAEKGTLTGALIKGVIEGSGSVIEGALRIGAMGGGVVFNLPQEAADAFNENITEKITPLLMIGIQADAVLKESRGMEFNPIISAAKTTDEYIQKRQEDSFAFSATYGVARSLPAMVTGGGGLIAQAYNDGYDIVDAAAGDKLSNQQKDAFALTFGVAQGLLERVGLQTVLGKGAASKLATEAIEAISKKGMKLNPTNIEGIIMNRLKPVLRGTAGEGATGAMQETSAIAIEEITDALSGEDFFDNEGIAQMTGRVLEGAALEAAGGFIMTSPSALVRSKAERISKEDYEAAKIVTSGEAFPETIDYIDAKEKSGELTTEEAAELKQDVSKFAEVDRQIPENLDVEKKIKAFKLIQEIEEKDKALTVPQQDRIKAINEELTNIVAPQETTKTDEKQQEEGGVQPQEEAKQANEEDGQQEAEVAPTKQVETTPEKFGFHGGTLAGKSDYLTIGYTGDQPFTGHYFFSQRSDAENRGDRSKEKSDEVRAVDFSKYNLLKPTTNGYWAIKSALKNFASKLKNGNNVDSIINRINSFSPELGSKLELNKESINEWYNEWADNKNKNFETKNFEKSKTERFETFLLKKLGYEGIDVRGLKESNGESSPDTSSEGSVIFDLKPETVVDLSAKENKSRNSSVLDGNLVNLDNVIENGNVKRYVRKLEILGKLKIKC
jgi:hypothetical protein